MIRNIATITREIKGLIDKELQEAKYKNILFLSTFNCVWKLAYEL